MLDGSDAGALALAAPLLLNAASPACCFEESECVRRSLGSFAPSASTWRRFLCALAAAPIAPKAFREPRYSGPPFGHPF